MDHPSPDSRQRSVPRLLASLGALVATSVAGVLLALAAAGLLAGGPGIPEGAVRWSLALGSGLALASSGFLLVSLTDRVVRAEAALREGESRFTQVTDALREVVWLSTADKSALLYVSPAFEDIWERPVEDAYADPWIWLEHVHPDDRERVRRAVPGQVEGDFDEEYRIVLPDGRMKWVRDRAFPVRGADGRAARIAGIAEEITRQKELEAEILRSHGLRSVARLAAGVAHDFNNHLTVVQSHVQLLLADLGDNPRLRADLEAIRASARACAELTRKLLAFGRQQVLVPRRVAPVSFLREVLPLLQSLLPPSVELEVDLPDVPLPEVEADPRQLREALLNVMSHSVAGMSGRGSVRVAVRETEAADPIPVEGGERLAPGRYVAIEVTDTGSGIPESVRRRLFEPFHGGVHASGGPDGLALASSLGIVQQSGGGIRVQAAPDGGTAFSVLLPVRCG
jgi:two-component system, cell cycle sensor histidine kinase and response regulator CckA